MQDLKNLAIEKLPFKFPIYYRYVDDIFLAVSNHVLDIVLQTFNSVHKKITIYNRNRKRKQN